MNLSVQYILSVLLLHIYLAGHSQTERSSICDPLQDSLELVKFYNAFDGDNWNNNTNWLNPGMPIETWYGVNIHPNGCVQSIYQLSNNPAGEIYELDFPELEILYISIGSITGALPDFQFLPQLEELRISNNNLSGSLPDFSSLNELHIIDLSSNDLEGEVPNFQSTPKLEQLFIGRNNFTGTLPDFNNLDSLFLLYADNNQFSGSLPNFTKLPSLEQLVLTSNLFIGEVPGFSGMPSLRFIDLGFNQLTGPLPFFENNPELERIFLTKNQLTGAIPDFQSIPKVYDLSLDFNQLSGSIPDFSNLPDLVSLNVGHNSLTGSIPDFSSTPLLEFLNCSYNFLVGTIPDFSKIPNLVSLDAQSNQLSGQIPDFSNLLSLKRLYLTKNECSGTIPEFDNCPDMEQIYLGNNQLTGTIPNFTSLPLVTWLYLNDNNLDGIIPDFTNLPNLFSLNLSGNLLTGDVINFSSLPELEYLYLKNNKLDGQIADLQLSPKLRTIDLSFNQLSSTIPDYSQHGNLAYLSLEGNNLSTPIPALLNSSVNIKNNKYTFSEILSSGNLATTKTFEYSPQQLIYIDTTILVLSGEDVQFDLEIDPAVTTNEYLWSKDDQYLFPTPPPNDPSENIFILPEVTTADAGRYTVRVTNSEAPSLYLYSRPISLRICDSEQDSLELVKLYSSTDGSKWINNQNWLQSGMPISSWHGITVNSLGCVQKIDLASNALSGTLPQLDLNTLDTLILEYNDLIDSFPEINTPFLKALDVSNNQLSGDFPDVLTSWMNLHTLDLGSNIIDGSIPPDLGDLCELETLRLDHNQINGELPEGLTMLTKLKQGQVDFSDNEIDSLTQKIIWFCPYGDTILEVNPSYDRFLGICNVACTGDEWESLDDYPWIVDSLNAISCTSEDCMAKKTTAGYVDARGITVFYIQRICYSQLIPEPKYLIDISLYDCAGNLLEFRTCDQSNYCAEFGALTSEEFDGLKYNAVWTCGDELEIMTVFEEPVDPGFNNDFLSIPLVCSPNPANVFLSCTLQKISSPQTLQMVNMLGVSIPVRYQFDADTARIECSDAPAGIYFILIKGESGQSIAKVIIE